MAHALEDGRSILMIRSTKEEDGRLLSNIRWSYGHVTIPRHLRDIVVTEYGIADLRGRSDAEGLLHCWKLPILVFRTNFSSRPNAPVRSSRTIASPTMRATTGPS